MKKQHLEKRLAELLTEHKKLERSIQLLKPKIQSYAREYYHITGEMYVFKEEREDRNI